MFCPKCGKPVKENDNFCRYCGNRLEIEQPSDVVTQSYIEHAEKSEVPEEYTVHHYEPKPVVVEDNIKEYKLPNEDSEELVIYDIKKHWMALFWPIFLTPIFFLYFWFIFLNTHSFFSWVIVFLILAPIVYPILRFNSDKIVITTKYAHIKLGVLNPEEIDIPLTKLDMLEISQTTMGRIMDYGMISFMSNGEQFDYGYIKDPGELQYLIENPARYIEEALEEVED